MGHTHTLTLTLILTFTLTLTLTLTPTRHAERKHPRLDPKKAHETHKAWQATPEAERAVRLAEQTPSSQLGATSEAFAQKVDRLVTLTLTLNLTLTLTLTLALARTLALTYHVRSGRRA